MASYRTEEIQKLEVELETKNNKIAYLQDKIEKINVSLLD